MKVKNFITARGHRYFSVSWNVYRAGRYARSGLNRTEAMELMIGIYSFTHGDVAPRTADIEKLVLAEIGRAEQRPKEIA